MIVKNFFSKQDLKKLNTRIKVIKYKSFIRELHKRIFVELVLDDPEGYLLPYRLGHLSTVKTKKLNGVFLKNMLKYCKPGDGIKEYNAHSFGNVYKVKWDKDTFLGVDLHYNKAYYFPNYEGFPLLFLRCYNFKSTENMRKLIKYKIDNQLFNLV
jgi:hypothetical protein